MYCLPVSKPGFHLELRQSSIVRNCRRRGVRSLLTDTGIYYFPQEQSSELQEQFQISRVYTSPHSSQEPSCKAFLGAGLFFPPHEMYNLSFHMNSIIYSDYTCSKVSLFFTCFIRGQKNKKKVMKVFFLVKRYKVCRFLFLNGMSWFFCKVWISSLQTLEQKEEGTSWSTSLREWNSCKLKLNLRREKFIPHLC